MHRLPNYGHLPRNLVLPRIVRPNSKTASNNATATPISQLEPPAKRRLALDAFNGIAIPSREALKATHKTNPLPLLPKRSDMSRQRESRAPLGDTFAARMAQRQHVTKEKDSTNRQNMGGSGLTPRKQLLDSNKRVVTVQQRPTSNNQKAPQNESRSPSLAVSVQHKDRSAQPGGHGTANNPGQQRRLGDSVRTTKVPERHQVATGRTETEQTDTVTQPTPETPDEVVVVSAEKIDFGLGNGVVVNWEDDDADFSALDESLSADWTLPLTYKSRAVALANAERNIEISVKRAAWTLQARAGDYSTHTSRRTEDSLLLPKQLGPVRYAQIALERQRSLPDHIHKRVMRAVVGVVGTGSNKLRVAPE